MQVQKTHKRKQGSNLDIFINWLNTKPVGYVYSCKEVRKDNRTIHSERLGYMNIQLMHCKCVKRVGRGKYEILGFIPDFVTQDLLEGTKGYIHGQWVVDGITYNTWQPNSTNNGHIPRGATWFMGQPSPYENEVIEEVKEVESIEPEAPVKRFTTEELLNKKIYILNFIEDTQRRISGPGGWIAREANWQNIENAQFDLQIIEAELKFRAEQKRFSRQSVLNILAKGLSHEDTATAIMNLTRN